MSVYSYLCCLDCKESLFVSDLGHNGTHIEPNVLHRFLRAHEYKELNCRRSVGLSPTHTLIFVDEETGLPDGKIPEMYIDANKKYASPSI